MNAINILILMIGSGLIGYIIRGLIDALDKEVERE